MKLVHKLFAAIILMTIVSGNSMAAELRKNQKAVVMKIVNLCSAPGDPCTPVSYKTSHWKGCGQHPQGCYEKVIVVSLWPGFETLVLTPIAEMRGSEQWVKVDTNICDESCSPNTLTGWIRRSDLALLGDFKPLKTWPRRQDVTFELGDYLGGIQISQDATFTYSGAVDAEGHNYPRYNRSGRIYRFKNILWANTKDEAVGFFFVENPKRNMFCWNQAGGDDESCFLSPFKPDGTAMTDEEFESASMIRERWIEDHVDLSFQSSTILERYARSYTYNVKSGAFWRFERQLADLSETLKNEMEFKDVSRLILAVRKNGSLHAWRVTVTGEIKEETSSIVRDFLSNIRTPQLESGQLAFGVYVHGKDAGIPVGWNKYRIQNPPLEGCNPIEDILSSVWPDPTTAQLPGSTIANQCALLRWKTRLELPRFIERSYQCNKQFTVNKTVRLGEIPRGRTIRLLKEEWHAEVCGKKEVFYAYFGTHSAGPNAAGPFVTLTTNPNYELGPKPISTPR